VHIVVNHLHLRERLTDATVRAARDGVQRVVDAGALAAQVAKVDDLHLVLILSSPERTTPNVLHARSEVHGCARTSSLCSLGNRTGASAK
jgi:hypothetical protein